MQIKLAEALLRRKELQAKVEILKKFKDNELIHQIRADRRKVTDSLEDVFVDYPKMTASQVTAEYDYHARQLRLVDAAIQQVNWTAGVEVDEMVMADYVPPAKK
jgi:hypothetical protein